MRDRRLEASHPNNLRIRIRELESRVAELEALLNAVPAKGVGSKESVARAVRRVAHAKGREETRSRLLDLAAAAQAWARTLAVSPTQLEKHGAQQVHRRMERSL